MSQEKTLSLKNVNIFRYHRGTYDLPVLDEEGHAIHDGAQVKVLISSEGRFDVKCENFPIRHGKTYGNRVQFAMEARLPSQNIVIFIFDGIKEVWELIDPGYVCFHEQEVGSYVRREM